MRIILDGCDGVGKSTLSLSLAKKYNCDIIHLTAWSSKNVLSYVHRLKNKNIIFDRSFISEVIYSKVYKRDTKINDKSIRFLLFICHMLKYKIFILTGDDQLIIERLKKRNDESNEILSNISDLNKGYVDFANKYKIPVLRMEDIHAII